MNIKKFLSGIMAALLFVCAFTFTSCAEYQLYSEGEGEIKVVCTTFIPFDFARVVGGEDITVTILQDSGADLHDYSPTTATLSALADADIFIYIGGESDEKWVDDAIRSANNDDLITVCLMDSIAEPLHAELENDWDSHEHDEDEHEHEDEDEHEHHADEHIWTSLKNACNMVGAIKDALCEKAPGLSDLFSQRAQAYIGELLSLNTEYAEAVSEARIHKVVVADRFPFVYMFHDYNIAYIAAFSGCSTEVNSSFETQISLINAAKASGAKYILTIEGNDKTLAEAVARESGCEICSLNSLQSVKRSDITSGISYLEVMKDNLKVLKEVLK